MIVIERTKSTMRQIRLSIWLASSNNKQITFKTGQNYMCIHVCNRPTLGSLYTPTPRHHKGLLLPIILLSHTLQQYICACIYTQWTLALGGDVVALSPHEVMLNQYSHVQINTVLQNTSWCRVEQLIHLYQHITLLLALWHYILNSTNTTYYRYIFCM